MNKNAEGYPSQWAKVTLMVSPDGEMHAISGDREPGEGDTTYIGLERIKKNIKPHSTKGYAPDILPNGNRRAEFAEQAEALREFADSVEKGEILSALWIFISRADDGRVVWDFDKFKARGMSSMELQGALHQALTELAMENVPE